MHREFAFAAVRKVFRNQSELLAAHVKIYAFGSSFWKKNNISDVDIVIIYKSGANLSDVKRVIDSVGRMIPLDVLYMTTEEEIELNFLAGQGATDVFENKLTIGCTRTPNSPLRSEFVACEPWRYTPQAS